MTLRGFIEFINANEEEMDIIVDEIDRVTISYPIYLSTSAKEHFKEALKLKVHNYCVVGTKKDYDNIGKPDSRLDLAWELVSGIAGYCSVKKYDEWFRKL